jgi:hypothetical protein
MLRLKTPMVVAAILVATAELALAAQFGSIALKAGETQKISLFGPGGYRRIRVCNNAESTANVSVTIQPRDPRLLQPSLCTENDGYELDLQNQGTGPATITFYPVSQGGFGMMGN